MPSSGLERTTQNMSKPKLAISFSGGRTSAVMTKLCVDKFSETHDIAITFANTGSEHENTLKFVDQCDKHFGWNVVWVEAVGQQQHTLGWLNLLEEYAVTNVGIHSPSLGNRMRKAAGGQDLDRCW